MTPETSRPALQLRDSSGDVVLREVVRIVLFFETPRLEMRDAARQAIVEFVTLVSLASFPYYDPDPDGEPEELTERAFEDLIRLWFEGSFSSWPNATIELTGLGVAPGFGLRYWGKALGNPALPDEASFLHVWMPREWFLGNAKRVGDYFRSTVTRSGALAAYVNPSMSGGSMYARQGLARRYRGLDIAEPSAVSHDIGRRVPGAYWINFLSGELVTAAGGGGAIKDALSAGPTIESMSNDGLLVRLSRDGQLGDVNRREELPAYVAFAELMNSRGMLHVPRAVIYFENEEGLADAEAQEAWHRRFLEPRVST